MGVLFLGLCVTNRGVYLFIIVIYYLFIYSVYFWGVYF